MRIQSSIIAITTLAVLAAVITALALSSFTAEAQGNSGAIANLQLTSTTAGTLTVSWDATSPVPTDYRVDWAKSSEDYKSWKVDEGHKYPDPSATTTTITDLVHDTEYKIRMRARYYRGEHEGKSWGGPWGTATITVAGEPAETPTPEPVKEEPVQQPPRDAPDPPAGTIETLTAADDTGQLLLTWTAPNSDPTDYHINWTKSTEEYPANTAEAGNAHPTDTTHTLAGLEYDTDYNIRVRARYSDGENAASHWNGPWTETTAQVHQPLPAAPSFINTAVTEGQVLLSWSNPSDDSITGYQILRGPDAANLVVIENDTGSSSTSYTDTAPPAGQTHTYGVKARNSAGLSPAGTATATVPAAEVLIVVRHEDSGNTLVSSLGQTATLTGVTTGTSGGRRGEDATPFTTGANPFGYHVTDVRIYLARAVGSSTPNPQVSIRSDDAGEPGETVLYTLTTSSAINSAVRQLYEFTTTDDFILKPNTKYWLHITTSGTNAMTAGLTTSDDEDTESRVHWRIGNTRYVRIDGGTWTLNSSNNLRIAISGHPAPAFLVSNLKADPGSSREITFIQTNSPAKRAQSFSAANNPDGSAAEFDFHGITVLLQASQTPPIQLSSTDLNVTLHTDTNGAPGQLLYTLTYPAPLNIIGDASNIDEGIVTFTPQPDSTLSSGITYWLQIEAADTSTFFAGDLIFMRYSNSDTAEVQGPYSINQWSIADTALKSPQVLAWETEDRSIRMTVLGSQRFPVLVSNIDQTYWAPDPTGPNVKLAQSFLTPPGPLGQQYRLHRVHINTTSQYPTQATVDLHADDDGVPGDHLASMIMPGDFAPGELTPADLITVAPGHTNLNPGTRYWIVITNEQDDNLLYISVTESNAQDSTSLDGWQIDNQRARSRPDKSWAILRGPLQIEVLGTPFIRTDEADGPDLPGAGHNAHKTGAVVIPGIVSTGHLTPGLDYDHGHSGDYWWLETQRGHSYRVEVKFGDNPDNNTGGSAWMSFIDPDHDDYPYASGCCEADHNRDDGHTFVHFYRPTDDWNNRYLINVAAFDKLNSNSRTYNGPYTITMTDITGTREFVSNLYQDSDSRTNLPAVGAARQYAMFFQTGYHAAGYKLDRIQTFITDEGIPQFSLYSTVSLTTNTPGDKLCDFRNPSKVQHHVVWSAGTPATTFLASACAEITLMPTTTPAVDVTIPTYYWIVMEGSNYRPSGIDSNEQSAYEPDWRIGDLAVTKTTAFWLRVDDSKTIPISVWLSER